MKEFKQFVSDHKIAIGIVVGLIVAAVTVAIVVNETDKKIAKPTGKGFEMDAETQKEWDDYRDLALSLCETDEETQKILALSNVEAVEMLKNGEIY